MGIDAKETGAILWKILEFSMNMSIKFMINHPILSGVSMFLLTLYIFLPSLLFFLIYSSPVLACVVVYVREKLGLRFSGSHKPFSTSEEKSSGGGEKSGGIKAHLRQQRSVRRNARMKVEEWDSQTSEEEKDKVILTSLYNDLLGRTPHFEESPKAETDVVEEDNEKDFGVEEDNEKDFGVEDSCDLGNLTEKPTVCDCEINEEKYGDLDGKEETREEMSNVNEYGNSEIDRSERLESLIARRRARRLFKLALDQRNKLQAVETTSPRQSNNLHITVPKNMNYASNNAVTGLQMPGSAPSVLLQGRNPFDIPYDPQEERPNLTGDSFDAEFSLFNQKDMFFCRHESFCRLAFFSSEPTQCMNSPASASDISAVRKRLDLDNEYMDHQIEQKLHCDGEEATIEDDDKSVESVINKEKEVEMNEETDSNKEDDDDDDDDSSSSEESESELNRLNKVQLREAIRHSMDNYPAFLVNQARNSIPSPLPKAVVAPRLDDNNMFYNRRGANSHSRTFSVASDMQVEVSEIGSPPTTVDWLDEWSNGGESYTYDTDIDREIIRGEESQKRLSHQCESSSGIGSKEENNGLDTKPLVETDQKHVVDEHLRAIDDTPLLDIDRKFEEDVKQVAEEIFDQRPCNLGDMFERSNSGKFDGLMFRTSVSLSSITEEPETVLDSFEGGILENMNSLSGEGTEQKSLTPLDSSLKKLVDEEVVDAKQLGNGDLFGSPKSIDLDITNHQQWNNVQGEHEEYAAIQRSSDASLDTSYIKSFEREMDEDENEEPNLSNFTEEETKQIENETLQSDFKSSSGQDLTQLLESKIMEENGLKLVDNSDDKAEPLEQETTQVVLKDSSSNLHTHLVEDDENVENLVQVQESNNSTDQANFQEAQKSSLMKDICVELTRECNNITNSEEEPVVSANIQNSKPLAQECSITSSERISPRTLEITIQPNHEEDIVPNTVSQDIFKESVTVAEDTTCSENNDEEDMKLGEAMGKKLEVNLESMHHSIGLVTKEDDEEFKKMNETMHITQT